MALSRQTLTISAATLNWARKTMFGGNIGEAAKKLGVTEQDILHWEKADPTITLSQLKKFSRIYKRHISVLLLPTPPKTLQPPKFRTLPDIGAIELDTQTLWAIRQAQEVQNLSIYLKENQPNEFIEELQKYRNNVKKLADRVINLLGITEEIRFKGKNSYEQLNIWKNLLGSVGVLVLEHSFPIKDMRAFAIFNEIAPAIILNSRDSDNARVFSLYHELGHLALGQSEVDKDFNLGLRSDTQVETFCNAFSATILVPDEILNAKIAGVTTFNDDFVKALSLDLRVSTAVIWRKLYDNKLIQRSQFNTSRSKLSNFENFVKNKKKKTGGNRNTHLYVKIKRKSYLFINEVFEAYNRRRITHFEVLDYIGIKADALPRLQQIMFA